jgi:hypothetical protein
VNLLAQTLSIPRNFAESESGLSFCRPCKTLIYKAAGEESQAPKYTDMIRFAVCYHVSLVALVHSHTHCNLQFSRPHTRTGFGSSHFTCRISWGCVASVSRLWCSDASVCCLLSLTDSIRRRCNAHTQRGVEACLQRHMPESCNYFVQKNRLVF